MVESMALVKAIIALRALRDMLAGEKDGNVSVKWDGAPSNFCRY
jgi:hypothetical protein